jgi:selenoprotein W-related protein
LATAIEAEYDVKVVMIPSGGGVFEVVVNGKNIWSKAETGTFPETQEILTTLKFC